MSDSLWPHGLYDPWNSPGQNTGVGSLPFSTGSSQLRDQTQVSTLQVDSLTIQPPGKPKNTGVGSLSLLQGIFPTQGSNQGLLHCRWILYQPSTQGSPALTNRTTETLSCCRQPSTLQPLRAHRVLPAGRRQWPHLHIQTSQGQWLQATPTKLSRTFVNFHCTCM